MRITKIAKMAIWQNSIARKTRTELVKHYRTILRGPSFEIRTNISPIYVNILGPTKVPELLKEIEKSM